MPLTFSPTGPKFQLAPEGLDSRVQILSDGSFLVVWEQDGIYAQRYSVTGKALTSAFQVSTDSYLDAKDISVMEQPGGGYTITWGQQQMSGSFVVWQSYLRTYDGSDTASGAPTAITGRLAGTAELATTALKYGGHVHLDTRADSDGGGIFLSLINDFGTQSSGKTLVNQSQSGTQYHPEVAALESGGFVVTWSTRSSLATYDDTLHFQIYTALGAKVGVEKTIGNAGRGSEHSVVGTPDGGFVFLFLDQGTTTLYGEKFEADGSQKSGFLSPFALFTQPGERFFEPVAAALPDGDFIVVWRSYRGSSTEFKVMGRRFNEDLEARGDAFVISDESTKVKQTLSLSVDPDGSFVVSWQVSGSADDGIFARSFDAQKFGTDNGETLIGTKHADWISGLAGSDLIKGRDGSDTLFGDRGNDKLLGGNGNDTLNGGAGRDNIFGERGKDKLLGGAGNDSLKGGSGKDIIKGGSGKDSLEGGALQDILTGNGGNDVFVFANAAHSGKGAKNRDIITDFNGSGDKIDLSKIDAKIGSGNQSFDFIGKSDFTGSKGELRYDKLAVGTRIQADRDGDGKADMEILLSDLMNLQADDFIL